jgi:hypothetical protein
MSRVKLLLGGLMLGDAFHIIPYLNRLLREGATKIYWVTGTYEQPAVEFLQKFYPIEPRFFSDGSPTDLSARFKFSRNHGAEFNNIEADISIADVEASLCSGSFESDRSLYILNNIHLLDTSEEDSIVLHPQTVHDWKKVPGVSEADWRTLGKTCYTVGHSSEVMIPNTIDFRGRSFFEVAQKIRSSKLVVGIHSAVACLTLHLDKSMIVCHPWKEKPPSAFLHFGYFREKMKDIINPPAAELLELARKVLEGESVASEPFEEPRGLSVEDQREVIEAHSLAELAEKLSI